VEEVEIRRAENRLFFRQWLKNPRQLGTVAPISVKLSMLAAKAALVHYSPGTPVIEIGAGTGRLTRTLLRMNVHPQDLTVVELDKQMCGFLRASLPPIEIIEGDANQLENLIPSHLLGKVGVVVCAIPLMYLSEKLRKSLMSAAFATLRPDAKVVHVTYNPRSPLRFWKGVKQYRVAATWFNMPPGFVWQFQKS